MKLTYFIVIICISQNCFAQSLLEFNFGVGYPWLSDSKDYSFSDEWYSNNNAFVLRPHAGIYYKVTIVKNLFFKSGLGYDDKGFVDVTTYMAGVWNPDLFDYKVSYNLKQLNIPLSISYNIFHHNKHSIEFGLGFNYSFVFAATRSHKTLIDGYRDIYKLKLDHAIYNPEKTYYINTFNAFGNIELQYIFNSKYLFSAKYLHSFNSYSPIVTKQKKLRYIGISLGYLLYL